MVYAKSVGNSIKAFNAKKRVSKKVSAPVKQAIVRAVRRANAGEVKFASLWNGQSTSSTLYGIQFNAAIQTGTNYQLIPPVPTGPDVGQRLGNKISPKRLVCDFWVCNDNEGSSFNAIYRMFILESLNIRDTTQINTVDMSTLLDYGQAQGPFDGYTTTVSGPVNKDQFKVLMDKTYTMNKTAGVDPAITNTYIGGQVAPNTNQIRHVRVSLKCPKVLHYGTAAQVLPDGWAPFFNMGYCIPAYTSADGVDTTITRLRCAWRSTLYYTDA